MLVHDIFGHHAVVIAINLRATEMDQSEPMLLLHADDVLGANSVRHPQLVVVVLSVPAPELSCEVVDVVELVVFEEAGDLHEARDIAAHVIVSVIVLEPGYLHRMSAGPQRTNQHFTDSAESAGH